MAAALVPAAAMADPMANTGELLGMITRHACETLFTFDAFNVASDPARRATLYGNVQAAIMAEVPFIKVGDVNALSVKPPKLRGHEPSPRPSVLNSRVEK
jgi:hypothetical protein